jgi:hypothetical protein
MLHSARHCELPVSRLNPDPPETSEHSGEAISALAHEIASLAIRCTGWWLINPLATLAPPARAGVTNLALSSQISKHPQMRAR